MSVSATGATNLPYGSRNAKYYQGQYRTDCAARHHREGGVMTKWGRMLEHEFGPLGVKIGPTKNGHYRLELPSGREVFAAGAI
jgi:hypothetical protein